MDTMIQNTDALAKWSTEAQKKWQTGSSDINFWRSLDTFDICMLLDGYSPSEIQELRKLYF